MKWFLVFYLCTNCGGDAGIMMGFQSSNLRYEVATANQETCEKLAAMNHGTECIAKVEKAKQP